MVRAAAGDWANYIKAAALRLQEKFRDHRLRARPPRSASRRSSATTGCAG